MATARDICREALTISGVVGLGDSIENDVLVFTLDRLNDVIGNMSSERLLKYTYKTETANLPNGTTELTIGPTGDIAAKRPYKIESIKYLQGTTKFLIPQITSMEFVSGYETSNSTSLPSAFAYFPDFPNGTIKFRNTIGNAYTIYVSFLDYIESYSLNDSVDLPANYLPYLKYATALEVSRTQGLTSSLQTLDPKVAEMKHNIMMQNVEVPKAQGDFEVDGWYDYKSDQVI